MDYKITPEWKVKFFPSSSADIEPYLNEVARAGWDVRNIIYLDSSACPDDPRVSIYLFRNRREHLTLGDIKVSGVDK
mgnify:FL=1